MPVQVIAVGRAEVPNLEMPDRFRHEITYFMALPNGAEVPALPSGEYWIRHSEAQTWYEDGVLSIVSPLDSENRTEVELSEEQENWLAWILRNDVQHVRVV